MQNNKTELNKSFEDNSQVRVLAFIEVKEGKRQELLDILISIIEPSRKEEGNISYFLNYSIDNPNEMVFDEYGQIKLHLINIIRVPILKRIEIK